MSSWSVVKLHWIKAAALIGHNDNSHYILSYCIVILTEIEFQPIFEHYLTAAKLSGRFQILFANLIGFLVLFAL